MRGVALAATPLGTLIERHREAIRAAVERRRGLSIAVFGSVARGEETGTSDIDFLVEFESLGPGQYADAYFGLLEELEGLFGRRVDLIVISAVSNPYFLESIERSRTLLYAA